MIVFHSKTSSLLVDWYNVGLPSYRLYAGLEAKGNSEVSSGARSEAHSFSAHAGIPSGPVTCMLNNSFNYLTSVQMIVVYYYYNHCCSPLLP